MAFPTWSLSTRHMARYAISSPAPLTQYCLKKSPSPSFHKLGRHCTMLINSTLFIVTSNLKIFFSTRMIEHFLQISVLLPRCQRAASSIAQSLAHRLIWLQNSFRAPFLKKGISMLWAVSPMNSSLGMCPFPPLISFRWGLSI